MTLSIGIGNFPTGTFDHQPAAIQMRAVSIALMLYFGSPDWLNARNRRGSR